MFAWLTRLLASASSEPNRRERRAARSRAVRTFGPGPRPLAWYRHDLRRETRPPADAPKGRWKRDADQRGGMRIRQERLDPF